MLGKIVNGVWVTPSENERRKIVITNPSDDLLKVAMGYKDLVIGDKPEYDEETQYLREVYTETDKAVTVSFEVIDIADEETEGEA